MMGRFATGVTVVAARHGPLLAGMTANAIASLSLDPPLLMASINRGSETHVAIVGSHSFAVSVLGEHQRSVALAERSGIVAPAAGGEYRSAFTRILSVGRYTINMSAACWRP